MKKHVVSYIGGLILLAAGLTAIAEESRPKVLSEAEYTTLTSDFDRGSDCIFSRTIKNWTMLDDQSLVIYAPGRKRPYYVKLNRSSADLRFARAISVYSKFDNRFCANGGNALFIDGDSYGIRAIQKLDRYTAKQLIAYHS